MLKWQQIDKIAGSCPDRQPGLGPCQNCGRAPVVWRTSDNSYVKRLNCALKASYGTHGEEGLVALLDEIVASWREATSERDAALQVFGHSNGSPGCPLWGVIAASGTKLFVLRGAVTMIYADHVDMPASSILLEAGGRPEFVSRIKELVLRGHSTVQIGYGIAVCLPVTFPTAV